MESLRGDRGARYFLAWKPLEDHLLDHLVVHQHLEDSGSSLVSRLQALVASPSPLKLGALGVLQSPFQKRLFRGRKGFLAVGTDRANQALGKGNKEHGGHQKRLDPHIEKPGHGARRVVRVHGAQEPVARLRRLHGDHCRFRIPDLTDHDHVRILPQYRPQAPRKGHAGFAVELDLPDVRDPVFNGILEGDDVDVGLIQLAQDRIETRALAAPRRTRAQDHAVWLADDGVDLVAVLLHHPQTVQRIHPHAHVEQPQDDVLAVNGGNR